MQSDYARIEKAIQFIQSNRRRQPSLNEIACAVGLSAFHFQRLFQRWAGITPKRLLQYLTLEDAKQLLRGDVSVLDTSLELGLSGPARLHDHFVSLESVTPGQYKNGGARLEIGYAVQPSPFGPTFVAVTDRGICRLSFLKHDRCDRELAALREHWPNAKIHEDRERLGGILDNVFRYTGPAKQPLRLVVCGSNFQVKVWEALLRIPRGSVTSYRHLANALGYPAAPRVAARAVASNPVAYLIPCHRVLRATGDVGGYRWGAPRKQAILAWEAATASGPASRDLGPKQARA